MNDRLALFGGPKVVREAIKPYRSYGQEEIDAAQRVLESGVLSGFVGAATPEFYGGSEVQRFERASEAYFGVKHAIAMNSWTSGLMAAVGAIGVEPGDEVIVTPWTMSATATAIINWNAIPVFADIERNTFCLDPESVEANITPYTRAIISVDIFGQSADVDSLNNIAERYGLKIISDSAQAPGAKHRKSFAGTLSDIGGYSLNYHKHIHTGEGGIVVTDDNELAERVRLIRNHAEAVVSESSVRELSNMIGYNFRLGEIEAAMGFEQLKKLDRLVVEKQKVAERVSAGLKDLEGLQIPSVRAGCTHVYYVYPLVLDIEVLGVSRKRIVDALIAEGAPGLVEGYVNLHLLPMYQRKTAYGQAGGLPWKAGHRPVSYEKGICPVAEELHDRTYVSLLLCNYVFDDYEIDLMLEAFRKVWSHLECLR